MTTLAHDYYDDRDWSEDGRLAQAHLSGDPDAFAALYRRYLPDLVGYLDYRLRDHSLAEDLAQETMERALRFLGSFDPVRPFWPWLRTIASRIATTETLRRAAEVTGLDVTTSEDTTVVDATEAFVSRAAVEDCLARIPLRQRRALVLRYVEDQDPSEIAAQFGLNRTAFEQLMWRARRNLAREYRARNAAPWLPLWPAIQRLRRLVLDITSRVNTVAGTGFSFAGDVALGAAITGIGISIATGVVGSPGVAHADAPAVVTLTHHADPVAALQFAAPLDRAGTAAVDATGAGRTATGSAAVSAPRQAPAAPGEAAPDVAGTTAPATDTVPKMATVTTPHDPVPTEQAQPPSYKTTEKVEVPTTPVVPAAATADVAGAPDSATKEGEFQGSDIVVSAPGVTVTTSSSTTNSGNGDDSVSCDVLKICL